MPRAIIPPKIPRVGPLPFTQLAALHDQGAPLPCAAPPGCDRMPLSPVWPAAGRTSNVGQVYDHTAEAPLYFADALQVPNRRVKVGAKTYVIVDAQADEFMPHVALRLREVRAGG